MVERKEKALVKEKRVEMQPGTAPATFPPPIFAAASVSWFHVSPPPPRENTWGVYI
jgi:hypothetical protein